jgi:membrane protein CcdC involved in cytochrome C biogenesis
MEKKDNIEMTRVAFISTGMIIFIIGLLLAMGTELEANLGVICLLSIVLLSANFFYHTGKSKVDGDERLAMVANEAMSFSWYLTLVALMAMLAIGSLVNTSLSVGQMLGIGLMLMISSMVGYNEIMVRKGVAE